MVLRPCGDYGAGNGYVDCYPQNGGGHHHFYESIKTELESFRLRAVVGDFSAAAATDMMLNDDTSSIVSKKRIDSLFKTTASVTGDNKRKTPGGVGRRTKSLMAADDDHYRSGGGNYFDYGSYSKDASNKNTVQEKIEKMFAEISSSELDTDVSMDSSAAVVSVGNSNKYHVQYIGCAGLSGKISSLEGLQQPVRDMYFEYRENQHHYQDNYNREERRDFSGLLEISAAGLTIRYKDDLGNYVHRTDPFQSIAVWAALKYVCRRRSPELQRKNIMAVATYDISPGYEYAFLPLIADPDSSDKAPLFRDVDAGDRARLDAAGDHAPVFAVVTRKAGKRLECHGFACETENDALLMAANLYGALVEAMSSAAAAGAATAENEAIERRAGPTTKRVIRQRNGFTSMSSTAGSSVAGADVAPALPPPRPPRRNKTTSVSSTVSSVGDGMSTSITGDGDVCSDAKTFQMTVQQEPSLRRGVCNSSSSVTDVLSSGRKEEPKTKKKAESSGGDILTKVAIPRSRSFLNSNGLASGKYSRRTAGCGIETATDRRRRRSNGSVMGFSDMFNELRIQEGLNNMDDILNAIINVEGMSYNDLKPIYKEFLTKLSMTLTKDELYQRTKAIMAEQKRKRNNKRRPVTGQSAKVGRGRRLNDKLRDALNLKAAKSRIGTILLPGFCKRKKRKPTTSRKQRRCSCSTKSSEIPPISRKTDRKNHRRATAAGKRSAAPVLKNRRHVAKTSPVCSTSDESDFFAAAALRQRQHQLHQLQQQQQLLYRKSKTRASKGGSRGTGTASEGSCLHRASSGYFSCSECSAGAVEDKCYCGRIGRGGGGDDGGVECVEPASLVSCSCDSDSCADSDKCYCGRPRRPRNIFDELKSRGFAASESSVSRADSPGTAWKKNELLLLLQQQHDSSCDGGLGGSSSAATANTSIGGGGGGGGGGKCSGIESSKSLEYLQVTRRHTACSAVKGGQQYSNVSKPTGTTVIDRMKVYAGDSTTTAAGSTSSPASSLSAATVYSSSSANGGGVHHRRQCRSSSSGSDNFHAIDYKLFANNSGAAAAGRNNKSRGHGPNGGRPNHHYYNNRSGCAVRAGDSCRPAAASIATNPFTMNRRSYSSEAVHLSGCRVYHHQTQATATRRHSVHDGYGDVLTSFFKSDIENSLGYYP